MRAKIATLRQKLRSFCLPLARRGMFRHEGLFGFEPWWMPRARVEYPDGNISQAMAMGNAADYAAISGGKVILTRANKRAEKGNTYG